MDYDSKLRRVSPALEVEVGPVVEVHTVGAKLSRRRLRRYVPIYDEGAVDRDLLVEGARNLRSYFQSSGFFDADVNFEEREVAQDHRDIDYIIDRGERHKLVQVEILGNKYFDTNTIRERMFLQPSSFPQFRRGRYSQGFLRRDREAILMLYRANGFRDVKVTPEVIDDYQGKEGKMVVVFRIEEGPQWFVSKLDVTGIKQLEQDQVLATLASVEGQPFSEVNVATDRDQILSFYYASGFPEATFDWKSEPGPQPNQVTIHYFIWEGGEQTVRDVLVSGLRTTRMRLVNPNVRVTTGGPLSLTQMGETQRRLYDLGVFAKVNMAIQNPDGKEESKYVLYQIEEGHKYTVAGGVGAEFARIGGTRTGLDAPAGAPGFSPRVSLEVTRLNFLGLGHSVAFKSRVSTLQRRGLLNYSAPRYRGVEGRNISFTALYDDSRDVRTFSARRLESSAQISQKLSKPTTAIVRFSYRHVSVDQNSLKIQPLLIPLLSQPVRIGMISGNLIQDRRNDSAEPRRGIYNTLDAGLASRFFASNKDFVRLLGRTSSYHPVTKHVVLARSLQLGGMVPYRLLGADSAQIIPLPERFFGGGGTSHRGFPDNQAGPRDPETGFPVGGKALLFHQTELRFPLIGDNINGVVFHDAGNIYSGLGDVSFRFHQRDLTDFNYMVHAAGIGIRYRTPIGPIRVDLAYSINPPRFMGFTGTRQELLFGQGVRSEQRVSQFQFFFSVGQAF
jgi:outer membrane protein assembly complex protein YaeT